MKRGYIIFALCLSACLLCGCSSIYDKEYVSVEDYVPYVQESQSGNEKLLVHNLAELKVALRGLVNEGKDTGLIMFDAAYEGNAADDMDSACWQLRTQDALGAYCVDNISYELTRIVTYFEATVSISYNSFGESTENIKKLSYTSGVELLIKDALEAGQTRLVVLINRSTYSAEDIESVVAKVYRDNPALSPRQPNASVNMFSGLNMQRLYEINLRYGFTAEELSLKKERMAELDPFPDLDIGTMDEGQRALAAYEWLEENCEYTPDRQKNTIYSALIDRQGDSEGMALAYVELCRKLDVECRIVYGQYKWEDHCWNIIRVQGDYYHVDPGRYDRESAAECFMLDDTRAWQDYRWDVSAYPPCTGDLHYNDVAEENIN